MASQIRFRSISLPSRLHPINSTEFEAQVEKLKSRQASSLSTTVSLSLTSDAIQSSLLGLAELYNSIEEITQTPSSQQSIQDALEGSVELLDSCSIITQLLEMMRESVRSLQSALRRKGSDCSIQNDIASYMCCRKKMNKCINKSLKTLKNYESRTISLNRAMRQVYGLTVAIFKSALLFLSSSSPAVKSGGWNVVTRLMHSKSVANVVSEVGCIDFALSNCKNVDKQMVQKRLQNVESCVEGIEAGLERVFKQLLQTRVTLLNIVTNHQ